ncbi:MAG: N-acetyltransferase, partial [Pricia sp.]
VLHHIQTQNLRVVPTSPHIAGFLRKNRQYKEMLPVGIRI